MNRISRRGLLASASIAASTAAEGQTAGTPDAAARKLKVIVGGGHPGDPEYGCGGTVARYTALGHEVVLLYLNRGDWGDIGEPVRVAEATKACQILKARPLYAGQRNGHAIVDQEHYADFRKLLEAERPDVLITQWAIDNHADHRAIFALVYDAWIRMGRRAALYFYEVSDGEDTQMFAPSDYVDISAVESIKRAACYAHASQTPDRYYELQTAVSRFRGFESGRKLAEGFVRHAQSRGGLLPGDLEARS